MAVDCGSKYKTPGLAHLLEHLVVFENDMGVNNDAEKYKSFYNFVKSCNGNINAKKEYQNMVFLLIDSPDVLFKSLTLFSDLFKDLKIKEKSIAKKNMSVNSAFQGRKINDILRIGRLFELLNWQKFVDGSVNSFGTNYGKLLSEIKTFFKTYYQKMMLVICSNLGFDVFKSFVESNFQLPLDELTDKDEYVYIVEQMKKNRMF